MPDKRAENERYPRLVHALCSVETNKAPYIERFLAGAIEGIPAEDFEDASTGGYPAVLVIGSKQFSSRAFEHLRARFPGVRYKMSTRPAIRPIDGYLRLMEAPESRLGWRILLHAHKPDGWRDAVALALGEGLELTTLVDDEYREEQLQITKAIARIRDGGDDHPEDVSRAVQASSLELAGLLEALGLEPVADPDDERGVDPESEQLSAPRILVTSLLGAKGLQASHVFVLGMNDGHFPRDNTGVTDDEACQLLVALTRGRKSCTLVSAGRFGQEWLSRSIFLEWLKPFVEEIAIDRKYFSKSG